MLLTVQHSLVCQSQSKNNLLCLQSKVPYTTRMWFRALSAWVSCLVCMEDRGERKVCLGNFQDDIAGRVKFNHHSEIQWEGIRNISLKVIYLPVPISNFRNHF